MPLQVFGEGADSVKKSLEGIFDDTVQESKVKKKKNIILLIYTKESN